MEPSPRSHGQPIITMSFQRGNALKLLAISGIVAPILVVALSTVAGSLRPSFNGVTQFGSELGVGDDAAAILANATDILYGLLIVAFAAGLHLGIGQRRGSLVGPASLGASGVASIAAGIIHCDPGCPLLNQAPSLSQSIHDTLFIIIEVAIILAPLAISNRLRNDSLWQRYRLYSIATGVVSLVLFIIFLSGVQFSNNLSTVRGTMELVTLIPIIIWTEVMAIRLLRLPKGAASMVTQAEVSTRATKVADLK